MIACKQLSETTHALHLSIFEQPAHIDFFNALLVFAELFIIKNDYRLGGSWRCYGLAGGKHGLAAAGALPGFSPPAGAAAQVPAHQA